MKKLPKELFNELVSGLQMLLALRLSGSPAADTVSATAAAWERALLRGKEWDAARDAKRFQTAFDTLAATLTWWPAPADFIKALPDPPPPLQIEYHYSQTESEKIQAKENLKKIRQMLGGCFKKIPTE